MKFIRTTAIEIKINSGRSKHVWEAEESLFFVRDCEKGET